MTMITTRRNSRINTDQIDEFHMEQFADRTIVVRAYRHARPGGSYMDKPISNRMPATEAIAYAKEVKPEAPIMWMTRINNYAPASYDWRERPA